MAFILCHAVGGVVAFGFAFCLIKLKNIAYIHTYIHFLCLEKTILFFLCMQCFHCAAGAQLGLDVHAVRLLWDYTKTVHMEANAVSLSVESSRWVLTTNTSDADAIENSQPWSLY